MKHLTLRFFMLIIFTLPLLSANFSLKKVADGLSKPWSMSFIDTNQLIITEKTGNLKILNLTNNQLSNINHNLNILVHGQGGLLDVLFHKGDVFVSYSENRGQKTSSTSVARANFNPKLMTFKTIFQAQPAIKSGYHFGSRLAIKGPHLFITAGERGQGMIAQDATTHPGSLIRIHLDGSIPTDNPRFINRPKWQPEIFQIGVRNPQGLAISPFDGHAYMSNHGAKGGDWFGRAEKGGNYGWKILGWGGTNYSGTRIGPKWQPGFTKAITYWVPSIAASAIVIYDGNAFPSWRGSALVTALKDKSLRKLSFNQDELTSETIIFKGTIGRIRDIKIHPTSGDIYLLSDNGELWQMAPKKQ